MTTSSREPASAGGRDHRNPWPASIGTGGRLRSESTADFVGMRKLTITEGRLIVASFNELEQIRDQLAPSSTYALEIFLKLEHAQWFA
jgi:hypothetical protein